MQQETDIDSSEPQQRQVQPSFQFFEAPPARPVQSRADYADLSPEEAVQRLLASITSQSDLSAVTVTQKRSVLTSILRELGSRGLDLASLQPEHIRLYRSYLADLVGHGILKSNTAGDSSRQLG
jgi:hypothetical protein